MSQEAWMGLIVLLLAAIGGMQVFIWHGFGRRLEEIRAEFGELRKDHNRFVTKDMCDLRHDSKAHERLRGAMAELRETLIDTQKTARVLRGPGGLKP